MGNFNKTNAKTSGSGFTIAEADFHNAVVGGLVDFGEVESEWDGEKKVNHKIAILYYLKTEIPDREGERYVMTQSYNFSFHEMSTMNKHLTAGFGSDFVNNVDDLESELLGKQVRVLIDHQTKRDGSGVYAKIDSLRPVKSGAPDVTMDGFALPKWIIEANEKGDVDAIAIYE
mgnify:CR=1 FL=1|tara:strand:+ start:3924 stop:4442 length:519 start_codon:yes stop_codon:yes gene_type:complete